MIRTAQVIQDLLLVQEENIENFKQVMRLAQVQDYPQGIDFQTQLIKNDQKGFKNPNIVVIVNRSINVFIVSNTEGQRGFRAVVHIRGNQAEIGRFTEKQFIKKLNNIDKEFGYIKESQFMVLYFSKNDPGNFLPFIEIVKNQFLVDSLCQDYSSKEFKESLKEVTRKDLIEMVVEDLFEENKD